MFKEVILEKLKNTKKVTVSNVGIEFFGSENKSVKEKLKTAKPNKNQNEKQTPVKMKIHNLGVDDNNNGIDIDYAKTQPVKTKFEDPKNSDNPKIAIPCIYDDIETAVKEQFDISDSPNMYITLLKEQKINSDTFDILESMKAMRDSIHLTAQTQKITKQDIDDYKENADGIIKIIKEL